MRKLETHRWTREAYDRMVAHGIFAPGERVELIDGEILTVSPQGTGHAVGVRLVQEALRKAFGHGFDVRPQLPLALDPHSEPEPDAAVVRGAPRDFLEDHPTPPATVLIVEVAESTLDSDRHTKGSLYARARIPEFWIVNLADRQVEVYRNPRPARESAFGWEYGNVQVLTRGSSISPLDASNLVGVDDLLP